MGYSVSIVVFGWNYESARFDDKSTLFLGRIAESENEGVYIIGVSAGGSAAVNALAAYPNIVRKVITVCSPLTHFEGLRHRLLIRSVAETERVMNMLDTETAKQILSVYGASDDTVPPASSQNKRVNEMQLPSYGHAASIFIALTLFAGKLQRFFK
jgi:esterase/lipase